LHPEPLSPLPFLPEHLAAPAGKAPVPPWAWLFVVACGAIPIVTLGGAIPAALGAGGASGCVGVARNPHMDVGTRVSLCTAITLGCWLGLFFLVGALTGMFW
jgi:hypothetical protein